MTVERSFARVLGRSREDLRDDETADAVIERAADDAVLAEFLGGVGIHRGVADAEAELLHLLVGRRADIDVEFVNLRRLLVGEAVLAKMDGGVADDAAHGALVAEDIEPPPARRGGVAAADAIDAQKAFLGDVLDDEADLVRVRFEHDAARLCSRAVERRPRGAVGVVFHASEKLRTYAAHLRWPASSKPVGLGVVRRSKRKALASLSIVGCGYEWEIRAPVARRGWDR